MDSKNEPLVPVIKKKVVKNEIKEESKWPQAQPAQAILAKNLQQQWPYFKANPILALLRSSQIFGLLRPIHATPGLLDLPAILMLQNNILNMLNSGNRQVGQFSNPFKDCHRCHNNAT